MAQRQHERGGEEEMKLHCSPVAKTSPFGSVHCGVEPPALGDSTVHYGAVSTMHCGFGWFGGYDQKALGYTLR